MLSPALSKRILNEHPLSDSTEILGIGLGSFDWICILILTLRSSFLYFTDQCVCEFGKWVPGRNAGGQVSRQTFYKNPTIEFEVPDRGRINIHSLIAL